MTHDGQWTLSPIEAYPARAHEGASISKCVMGASCVMAGPPRTVSQGAPPTVATSPATRLPARHLGQALR